MTLSVCPRTQIPSQVPVSNVVQPARILNPSSFKGWERIGRAGVSFARRGPPHQISRPLCPLRAWVMGRALPLPSGQPLGAVPVSLWIPAVGIQSCPTGMSATPGFRSTAFQRIGPKPSKGLVASPHAPPRLRFPCQSLVKALTAGSLGIPLPCRRLACVACNRAFLSSGLQANGRILLPPWVLRSR